MSKLSARWIDYDNQSLENASGAIRVFLDPVGGIERTLSGLRVKTSGITNDMLAGSIALTKLTETVVRADGVQAMTADLNMGSNKITNLAAGTAATDAINKSQLDAAVSGLDFQADILDIQTNDIWEWPAAVTGDRYIITNASSLHANFGVITGLENNDIVEYNGSAFIVAYDVSTHGPGALTWNRNLGIWDQWNGTSWSAFGGLSGVTAGDGIDKTGNTLNVVVADFAGTGLEDDAANNLRLTTQGNGIAGGAGTALSVKPDITTGGDTFPVSVGANGVGVDITTLDGDHLDITFDPSNYTPDATPVEAADADDLVAHLKGIDTAIGSAASGKIKKVMHEITSGEITNGYFSLPTSPENGTTVSVIPFQGPMQVNKQNIGAISIVPDFDVLNTTQLHINNNGTATGLSESFVAGDIVMIEYAQV